MAQSFLLEFVKLPDVRVLKLPENFQPQTLNTRFQNKFIRSMVPWKQNPEYQCKNPGRIFENDLTIEMYYDTF